ncbi:MAG: DUF5667 domain-containing protein [bacterium]|nr:DUF5667 domain-containing protein [bacterium]
MTLSIFLFLLMVTAPVSFTQGQQKSASSAASDNVPTPSAIQSKVEYTLPYPGILPGHPLYSLKMIRDQISSWFITDPLKKAEFNLLQADKRLNSGLFLLDKGKTDLAESTFSKGENYLEQTIAKVEGAKKAGKDISAMMSKLSLATLKHQEVLTEVLQKIPESNKKGIKESLDKSQKTVQWVREAQTKKLEQRIQEKMLAKKRSLISPVSAAESK